MKLHVLCNDGSPIGVTLKDLWGDGNRGIGVGGSEYALLTMCEEWHKRGDEVVLFNSPMTPNGSPFEQRRKDDYDPNEKRDVLIVFRTPNDKAVATDNCLKVWWSCDQYTSVDFKRFAPFVDKTVCISKFHANYFRERYQINDTIVIDLPIRIGDFIESDLYLNKESGKVIFTSVPDRGLDYLWRYWPSIKKDNPDITLTITSDYRLWGVDARNDQHRTKWMYQEGVRFLGAITRKQLLQEQATAQILAYPCTYDELFCVSIAEAQCLGVYPVTSNVGALETTNMGTIIVGNPANNPSEFGGTFRKEITDLLHNQRNLSEESAEISERAYQRFSPKVILEQWDEKVFK